MLTDVATSAGRNGMQKRSRKEAKIKEFNVEIQRMLNTKCVTISVIIIATRIITKRFKENMEVVTGRHSVDSLQEAAQLGTSHTIRKVLQCETGTLSGGDRRWFKRNTKKKRPVTRDDEEDDDDDSNNNNNNNKYNKNNSKNKDDDDNIIIIIIIIIIPQLFLFRTK